MNRPSWCVPSPGKRTAIGVRHECRQIVVSQLDRLRFSTGYLTYAGADERFMDGSRRLAPPLLLNALAAQLGR